MNRIITMRLIIRNATINNHKFHTAIRLSKISDSPSSSDSSDSSDSDNEKSKKNRVQNVERDEASKKQTNDLLNSLLANMSTNQLKSKTVDRAIPKRTPLPKPVPEPTLEEKIIGAAKDAADSLGGDVKQTEVELLNKILSAGAPTPSSTSGESTPPSQLSLSELLSGMKIDRTPRNESSLEGSARHKVSRLQEFVWKSKNIGNNENNFKKRHHPIGGTMTVPGDLYGGSRLNIFNPVATTSDNSLKLKTWNLLEENELKLMITNPPKNIFEELIQWTEKGLLWKFPIDNEIAMEEEQNIHFSEHVFMDRHLKGWCPTKGPIQHFMNLVCVGLSKNPYMTVQEKKDHIMWYRDFFGSKQELLKQIGAVENDFVPSDTTKQIET